MSSDSRLRELHHLVSNHMQLISSLLRMQFHLYKDKEIHDGIELIQRRIKSIAILHEKLSCSDDLNRIDLKEYLQELVSSICKSYSAGSGRITVKVEIEKLFLEIDTAVACGLIVNETVAHFFQYAFPGDRKGEIAVNVRCIGKKEVELTLNNDGIDVFDSPDSGGTGFLESDFLSTMVEKQLKGTLSVNKTGGQKLIIIFNI